MLAGHFVINVNRCDFLPHRIFHCSFKSGWEWCGLSVILLYCQVDKMLKIMIELSSTYEYFQRARTHTLTHARARIPHNTSDADMRRVYAQCTNMQGAIGVTT